MQYLGFKIKCIFIKRMRFLKKNKKKILEILIDN